MINETCGSPSSCSPERFYFQFLSHAKLKLVLTLVKRAVKLLWFVFNVKSLLAGGLVSVELFVFHHVNVAKPPLTLHLLARDLIGWWQCPGPVQSHQLTTSGGK